MRNNNVLYALIGVLVLALVVIGWLYLQERNTKSLSINMGNSGISVQTK